MRFVTATGRGAIDACLAEAVTRMEAAGIRLAGTVQTNIARADRAVCDMDIRVLPDGPVFRISQDLGVGARGCRLDPGALESAVTEVEARLDGAALLIVNKFGKQEAEGRGLVNVIADATARGIPVIVGVNRLNLPVFLSFADGLAAPLPTDPQAIADWVLAAIGQSQADAAPPKTALLP